MLPLILIQHFELSHTPFGFVHKVCQGLYFQIVFVQKEGLCGSIRFLSDVN